MTATPNAAIATIGFTQSTAEHFFERLIGAGVRKVVDVRLHNTSQLAGFAKAEDLAWFLAGSVTSTTCTSHRSRRPRRC